MKAPNIVDRKVWDSVGLCFKARTHAHNNDKKRANGARNIATLLSQRNQCRGARWGKQSKHSTTQPANHLAPLTILHNRHPDNESGQCVGDITWVTDTWTVCRVRDVTRTQRHAPPNVQRAPPVTTGRSCHRI